jgi:uncharacterized protein (TIGR02996 family)
MNDEQAFLNAILQQPDDDTRKLVYADWLEERGDSRGEFLRLMMKVRQDNRVPPELRERHRTLSLEMAKLNGQMRQLAQESIDARKLAQQTGVQQPDPWMNEEFRGQVETARMGVEKQLGEVCDTMRRTNPPRLQELAAQMDPNWLAVVSDPEIDTCALPSGRFRLSFVCTRSWSDLTVTEDLKVRHCGECKQNVYFCDTIADVRKRIHNGEAHCVCLGIPRKEGDEHSDMALFGNPGPESLWDHSYTHGMDDVSKARMKAMPQAEIEKKKGRTVVVWTLNDHGNFITQDGLYALRPRNRKGHEGQFDVYRYDKDEDEWYSWKQVSDATKNYFGVNDKDRRPDGTWEGWL